MTNDHSLGLLLRLARGSMFVAAVGLAGLGYAQAPARGSFSVDAQSAQAAAAPALHMPRRHLGRAVPVLTPQLAYVVPIDDGTELGIANLDKVTASIEVYGGTTAVDKTIPATSVLSPGAFEWVRPGPGAFAIIGVGGANPDLVQIIAQHMHTVDGNLNTETVAATAVRDMLHAGDVGWLPDAKTPARYDFSTGTRESVLFMAGPSGAAFDMRFESMDGQDGPVVAFTAGPWSSVAIPQIWSAFRATPPPGSGDTYMKFYVQSGVVAVASFLTETSNGKQSTLFATNDVSETEFAFPAIRQLPSNITEAHVINPVKRADTVPTNFHPFYQPRDTTGAPADMDIRAVWHLIRTLNHNDISDVITGLIYPQTYNDTRGMAEGYGALWVQQDVMTWDEGDHAPLLVWLNQRIIKPEGDFGQWTPALHPSDACGGAENVPCSLVGIQPASRLLLSNRDAVSLSVVLEFYDASGARIGDVPETFRSRENKVLDGIVPPGAVRVVSRSSKGSYYFLGETPTAGYCVDRQGGKRMPGA